MRGSSGPRADYHQSILDDENTRRLLKVFIGLALGGSLLYFIALPFSADYPLLRGVGILAADLCFIASFFLLRRGQTAAAATLLIWGAWAAMFMQVAISNGLLSRTLIFAPVVIVLAAWLLTARGAIVLSAATLLAGLALALAERAKLLPLLESSSPTLLTWLAFSIYVALAGAVAYHIFRGFRLRHEALARRESELNLLMKNVPSMIFHGDRDKRCLYANRAYAEFYARDTLPPVGRTVREILGEAAYTGVDERLDRVLAGRRLTYRGVRKSPRGEMRTLDIDLLPEFGEGDAAKGFFAVINDVTDSVQAEDELRRSEQKFAGVFRSSPLAVAITRLADGRYLDVNEAFVRLFGWQHGEVIGRTSLELSKWADPAARDAWAAALRRDGRVTNLETGFRTRSGDVRRVLLSAELIEIAGEPCALVMTADITDRLRAEQALMKSEERLRLATGGGRIGIWEWNIATNELDWNIELKHIFGQPGDTAGLTLEQFVAAIHPEDRQRVQQRYMNALDQRTEFDCEYRILRPDGNTHWIVARGHGDYDEAGRPWRMVGIAFEVTERRRAEEKFATVFRASPVAISISRIRDGLYLDVNDAFVEQFGWTRDEFIGHTSVGIGLWPGPAVRDRFVAELQRTGRVKDLEAVLNTKSGRQRSVLISAERIVLDDEECLIGMVHDVTERQETEAALRASEARLREAQRIGHVGSWELDFSSRLLIWSDELYRIYEMAPGTFGGRFPDLLEKIHPDDRERISDKYYNSASVAGNYDLEHRIVTPKGNIKHVRVHWEMFLDAAGKPLRAIGTARDITGQVLAQEEIRRLNAGLEQRVRERTAELTAANKELESFSYSISHDLRAPLRGIDGFSHLLAEEYGARLDETGRNYLERVRRAAQRMGELIDDILELSRVTRLGMRRAPVDLSELASEILDERLRAAPGNVVEAAVSPGCSAFGDPQLLRVLMQNLLENAWKYSAKEAAPKIEFGRERLDGEEVFFVRDNGVGFDMQYAERLFAPFQRLHSPEEFEGTGIGLATVARVVHRHGGRVWAEAAPGKGACFRFTLSRDSA